MELALVMKNKARAQTVLADGAGIELCKHNEEQNVCAGLDMYQSGAYAAVPANGPAANESQPPSPAATARRFSGDEASHRAAKGYGVESGCEVQSLRSIPSRAPVFQAL